ncbi:MAG: 30S ribosomal protein S14, partial [archaeon]|nr:30S ribosomal protein S14 [archaeon]
NKPKERSTGLSRMVCRRCGKKGKGVIKSYHLYYCHQCFREIARELGFKKYD